MQESFYWHIFTSIVEGRVKQNQLASNDRELHSFQNRIYPCIKWQDFFYTSRNIFTRVEQNSIGPPLVIVIDTLNVQI